MTTIRFWALPHYGFETAPLLRSFVKEFERKNPGTRIEISVRTSSSLWKNLIALLKRPERLNSTDARPDVIQIPSYWTSSLARLGILSEISGTESVSLDEWVPVLREQCVLSETDRVFSLPWYMEIGILYYRSDLLRKAKIDPENTLSTWEGLAECCRILGRTARSGFFPLANPNPKESISLNDVASNIWSRGGDFFSPDGARSLFHRPEALGGIRSHVELLDKGWMPLSRKTGLISGNLFDGHCALQFSGRLPRDLSGEIRKAVKARPYPQCEKHRASTVTAYHVAIVQGGGVSFSQARKFVSFLTGSDPARSYASVIGAFPTRVDWANGAFKAESHFEEAFQRSFNYARLIPNLPIMATLEQIFDRSMERLIRDILRRDYREEELHREMLYASAEMDYALAIR